MKKRRIIMLFLVLAFVLSSVSVVYAMTFNRKESGNQKTTNTGNQLAEQEATTNKEEQVVTKVDFNDVDACFNFAKEAIEAYYNAEYLRDSFDYDLYLEPEKLKEYMQLKIEVLNNRKEHFGSIYKSPIRYNCSLEESYYDGDMLYLKVSVRFNACQQDQETPEGIWDTHQLLIVPQGEYVKVVDWYFGIFDEAARGHYFSVELSDPEFWLKDGEDVSYDDTASAYEMLSGAKSVQEYERQYLQDEGEKVERGESINSNEP